MRHLRSGALCAGALVLSAAPSFAAIVNGGFETGDFSGWTTAGNASIQTSAFGSGPAEGSFQALITNGDGSVSAAALETFLGLDPGSLDALASPNEAIEGSGLRQTFAASAGDVLSFQWNFLTSEDTPDDTFNDFAFVQITQLTPLADTFSTFFASLAPFFEETGFQTFNFVVPGTGTYSLGIGIVDVDDVEVDSGLLIDDVRLTPTVIPLPSSALLGLPGLAMLGACYLRRRRAQH